MQRELVGLVAAELVTRKRDGHQVYFQANRDSHVFAELQALLSKTVGTVARIRSALATLGSEIDVAWIFGSFARSAIRKGSDIDLMVVGRTSFAAVVDAMSDPQRSLGREINPVVYTPEEFRKKLASGHRFLSSVVREPKQFVIGDDDGVAGLAQERDRSAPLPCHPVVERDERSGTVSEADVTTMRDLATSIRDGARAWIAEKHRALLPEQRRK